MGTESRFRSSVAAIVVAASLMLSQPAAAQLFFDWGGEQTVNDSGRQVVKIGTDARAGEIIVSFSDRRLYLMTQPGVALSYPIAIPREQDRWEGQTTVTQKRENPSWTPTPSMIKENPRLPRWVPGGHPMNPLGNRALYLGSSFYRIHGTDAPWTIGTAVSKGCIRLYNKDAQELYERSKVGAKVLVTWKTYQVAAASDQIVAGPTSGARGSATQGMEPTSRRQRQRADDLVESATPHVATERQQPQARPARNRAEGAPQRNTAQEGASPAPVVATSPAATVVTPRTDEHQAESLDEPQAKAKASSIETGAVPERRQPAAPAATRVPLPAKAAALPEAQPSQFEDQALPAAKPQAQPVAIPAKAPPAAPNAASSNGADIATRALEAAERAAAAAERAAAAAERAERAVSIRAASRVRAPSAVSAPATAPGEATASPPASPPASE